MTVNYNIGVVSLAQSFRMRVGILSGQDALFGSKDSRRFCTPPQEITISGIAV